jgi:hypothetical protein
MIPSGNVPPDVLAALEQAIADYQTVVAKRAAREEKMAELEAIAAQGILIFLHFV